MHTSSYTRCPFTGRAGHREQEDAEKQKELLEAKEEGRLFLVYKCTECGLWEVQDQKTVQCFKHGARGRVVHRSVEIGGTEGSQQAALEFNDGLPLWKTLAHRAHKEAEEET